METRAPVLVVTSNSVDCEFSVLSREFQVWCVNELFHYFRWTKRFNVNEISINQSIYPYNIRSVMVPGLSETSVWMSVEYQKHKSRGMYNLSIAAASSRTDIASNEFEEAFTADCWTAGLMWLMWFANKWSSSLETLPIYRVVPSIFDLAVRNTLLGS